MDSIDLNAISAVRSAPSKGDQTKIKILKAAIECINKIGIERSTFEAIGRELGIGKAHVAYHFKKKDQLVLATIEYIALNARGYVDKHLQNCMDPSTLILCYVEAHKHWMSQFKTHASLYTLFFHYCIFNPTYREMNERIRLIGKERILTMLKLIHPQAKDHKDLPFIANSIQQFILAACMDSVTLNKSVDSVFDDLIEQTELLCQKLYTTHDH